MAEDEENLCMKTVTAVAKRTNFLGSGLFQLLRCVNTATCLESFSAFACKLSMAVAVLECMGVEQLEDVARQLIQWVNILELSGIREFQSRNLSNEFTNFAQVRYSMHDRNPLKDQDNGSATWKIKVIDPMRKVCPQAQVPAQGLSSLRLKAKMHDVALVITINYVKLYGVVPYLEFLHRQAFRHVVYCVPDIESFRNYTQVQGLSHLTFIDGLSGGWFFMYECAAHVMRLDLPVKGILQIGDDVLLNTWMLQALPRDKIWWFPEGQDR